MKIRKIKYSLVLAILSVAACGGGGDDGTSTIGMSASITSSALNATEEFVLADSMDAALASNGESTTDQLCIDDGSGFNGCYVTDCSVYSGDFGVELGIREAYTINDVKIIGLKAFYNDLNCIGAVRADISRSIASWTYQFETMSDSRAIVRGQYVDLISIANVSIDILGYRSGFSLWELQNEGDTLCLSNGPEGTSDLFVFTENLADLGTSTTGDCATRFTPAPAEM